MCSIVNPDLTNLLTTFIHNTFETVVLINIMMKSLKIESNLLSLVSS